jgi:hypothetical protein
MKKTTTRCFLKYLCYITVFVLIYFLIRLILNKYHKIDRIEGFNEGIPMIKGVDNAGNYVLWGAIILTVIGLLVFSISKIRKKMRINRAASNLGKELEKTWGRSS